MPNKSLIWPYSSVYENESSLYYLQSRYYDPQLGRFINADVLAATGQGPVGNNMFTYCLNNPVNRTDSGGSLGIMFWSFVGVVAISAGANAISTAISGGSLEECLLAGLAGGAGAAAGFAVAWATGFSPQGNILGRATATVVSDLGTAWLINGELTTADYVQAGIDVTMDVCFSTVGYYYTTSIENEIVQNCVNAGLDGLTDIVETKLFYTTSDSASMNTNYSGFLPNSAKTSGGTYQNVAYMY